MFMPSIVFAALVVAVLSLVARPDVLAACGRGVARVGHGLGRVAEAIERACKPDPDFQVRQFHEIVRHPVNRVWTIVDGPAGRRAVPAIHLGVVGFAGFCLSSKPWTFTTDDVPLWTKDEALAASTPDWAA